ncbi:hypothetical protein QFZ88_002144 [Mesorhizobium sp. YL-MeA3-2017]|nr:hypothetical protein [Mesorhizobium sp. YL-MeA3-2017]
MPFQPVGQREGRVDTVIASDFVPGGSFAAWSNQLEVAKAEQAREISVDIECLIEFVEFRARDATGASTEKRLGRPQQRCVQVKPAFDASDRIVRRCLEFYPCRLACRKIGKASQNKAGQGDGNECYRREKFSQFRS